LVFKEIKESSYPIS